VADVMNYIMTSWSNKQTKVVTEKEVAAKKNKIKFKIYLKHTLPKNSIIIDGFPIKIWSSSAKPTALGKILAHIWNPTRY
jgi:hypothetical protein